MWKKKDYLKTDSNKNNKTTISQTDKETKNNNLASNNTQNENHNQTSSDMNKTQEINNSATTQNAQIIDNESFNENIFSIEKNTDKTKLIMAKILKELRQNDEHLLQSVFQDFENAIIVENKLIVSFSGENYKDILEKTSNLTIINDIISSDGLIVEYKFETTKKEKKIDEILKEKFNKINIKE